MVRWTSEEALVNDEGPSQPILSNVATAVDIWSMNRSTFRPDPHIYGYLLVRSVYHAVDGDWILFRSWEFFISLGFEWSFVRGQKKFNWPMVNLVISAT